MLRKAAKVNNQTTSTMTAVRNKGITYLPERLKDGGMARFTARVPTSGIAMGVTATGAVWSGTDEASPATMAVLASSAQ